MTIATEFPDYDLSTLPVIPEGFVDCSWRNDTCPTWHHEAMGLSLCIDYADPLDREWLDETARFSLTVENACGEAAVLLVTDDWSEVLEVIAGERMAFALGAEPYR